MKTPTDAGLLPCPFCGAAAHFEIDEGRWEWVECESCGMQGNRSASLMEDCKPKLREEWNRRTPLAGASGEPEGWITWWPVGAGRYAPGYSHGPIKPNHGPELDEKLRKYPVYLAPPPQAVLEPSSYQSGSMMSTPDGGVNVHLHFAGTAGVEDWFDALTDRLAAHGITKGGQHGDSNA